MKINQLQILIRIFKEFLNLDDEHCYIYNQKWNIPLDGRLCLVLGLEGTKAIANNKRYKNPLNDSLRQSLNVRELQNITVNIFSYNFEAIDRKDEVLFALQTDKAQNEMNRTGFSIAELPNNILNINETDGAKILYRFMFSFSVWCGGNYETNAEYYDKEKRELIVDN
jgi:hypothetical protein